MSLRCRIMGKRGRRAVVAPALMPYGGFVKARTHGHREAGGLGMAFVPSFQYRAGPNHEQACCSHSKKKQGRLLYRIGLM